MPVKKIIRKASSTDDVRRVAHLSNGGGPLNVLQTHLDSKRFIGKGVLP